MPAETLTQQKDSKSDRPQRYFLETDHSCFLHTTLTMHSWSYTILKAGEQFGKSQCPSIYMYFHSIAQECTNWRMNRKNPWPSPSICAGRNTQNFQLQESTVAFQEKKPEESLDDCICSLRVNLSETTIGSPLEFCPLSLAPKGRRKPEWRRSQSCRRGKCLLNLQEENKATCIRYHGS